MANHSCTNFSVPPKA